MVGFVLLGGSVCGAAGSHSRTNGITVSLRMQSLVPPDQEVCTGGCRTGSTADVTVWNDGQVLLNRRERFRISKAVAARFRGMLIPFRRADTDASKVLPNSCPVKIQWPADDRGLGRVTCAYYSVGGIEDPVFTAVSRAFEAIGLDKNGNRVR